VDVYALFDTLASGGDNEEENTAISNRFQIAPQVRLQQPGGGDYSLVDFELPSSADNTAFWKILNAFDV
jgi:hypothetical protein